MLSCTAKHEAARNRGPFWFFFSSLRENEESRFDLSTWQQIKERAVIPTREFHLREFFSSIKGYKSLTFEEGAMAKWLVGVLHGAVDKITVCNPMYITKKTKAKIDYIDALHLATELRAGNLVSVYHDH